MGREFHAALVSFRGPSGCGMHAQDFAEMMFVLAGRGTHAVNGIAQPLREGDLVLVRTTDRHAVQGLHGGELLFVNVAFPDADWRKFLEMAGLRSLGARWASSPLPPSVHIPISQRHRAADAFNRALRAFQESPSRLELFRFWLDTSTILALDWTEREHGAAGPEWLYRACRAIKDERNLRDGLSRFVALGGVSAPHFSRTLKRYSGLTPTDYLNNVRLERAAVLLATTPREIIAIAGDCGFESLSYFYRLFGKKYGITPALYRIRARKTIAP